MKTALVLLSGGMDSAAALWWARSRYRVRTLTFRTPATPREELRAARRLARRAGVLSHRKVALDFLGWKGDDRPQGYLPARNLVFMAAAASIAEQERCDLIVAGQLATDHKEFPDARAGYLKRAADLAGIPVALPFIRTTKRGVVRFGRRFGVPFELTWSCYRDGRRPCGRCVSCREREQALQGPSPERRRA